jgi:pseudouridine-5'-monophosphatase
MMGKKYMEACRMTVAECGLRETADEYAVRFERAIARHWPHIGLLPGVVPLVEALAARGTRMCIATGSGERSFRQKVASHPELVRRMDHCITGDDVSRGKPDPDLFLLALARWEGMRPDEVIVFEDSPLGIEAANRAGIPAVFVPDRHMLERGVFAGMTAKPLLTIASLADFDLESFRWADAHC